MSQIYNAAEFLDSCLKLPNPYPPSEQPGPSYHIPDWDKKIAYFQGGITQAKEIGAELSKRAEKGDDFSSLKIYLHQFDIRYRLVNLFEEKNFPACYEMLKWDTALSLA